jgi:asparagine synthase (glutamine-hydrolysing)
MNAVAAVFGAAPPQAARAAVARMLDRMPERAAGHRVVLAGEYGVVGAAGKAPVFSSGGAALLAGDLRLDNAGGLRGVLGLAADAPAAVVVIEAFARWRDDFAAQLVGDFAVVMLDRQERRLIAVRDPLGIRPLFYRRGTSHVRIASELRALVEPGDDPDEGFLAEVLSGSINDVEATPYLSVRRLPAGHVLIATETDVRVARYWEPAPEPDSGSPSDHAERVRAAFDEAVRARCEGAAHVGVHLSGGLSSASVFGAIHANQFAAPVAGALRFPWPEADESEWTTIAARRWSTEPVVFVDVDPAGHDLASVAAHADIPDDPTGSPVFAPLQPALKGSGAGCVLTGFGGADWWSSGPEEASASGWRAFADGRLLPLIPAVVRRGARRLVRETLPAWVDPAFAARVGLRDRLRRRPDTSDAPGAGWRRMRLRLGSGEEAFRKERLDRLAVASGLELRHPFYDRRVVELAFAMPDAADTGDRTHHEAMVTAMSERLAPDTASRTARPDWSRLLVEAASAPDVQRYLSFPALSDRGWVNQREVASLVERVRAHGDAAAAAPLWRVIAVEACLTDIFGAR